MSAEDGRGEPVTVPPLRAAPQNFVFSNPWAGPGAQREAHWHPAGARLASGPDERPWIPGPHRPALPPRRSGCRSRAMLAAGGIFAGLLLLGGIASAFSHPAPAARPAPAPRASSAPLVPAPSGQAAVPGAPPVSAAPSPARSTWSAAAATVTGCRELAAWENGDSNVTFNRDPQSREIIAEAAGTQFASDLRAWVADLDNADVAAAKADAAVVGADCEAAGVHTGLG